MSHYDRLHLVLLIKILSSKGQCNKQIPHWKNKFSVLSCESQEGYVRQVKSTQESESMKCLRLLPTSYSHWTKNTPKEDRQEVINSDLRHEKIILLRNNGNCIFFCFYGKKTPRSCDFLSNSNTTTGRAGLDLFGITALASYQNSSCAKWENTYADGSLRYR